ncbi:hypothetical protein D9O50_02195 [Oxalobacteraceae bacterium CAVE-383]|nr:hypothetical protein D9O50_02195 [Oxalobacteraceae bacterium CAVE-383]
MKKLFIALAVATAFAAAPVSQALAQAAAPAPAAAKPAAKKAPVKKAVKKAPKKETHPKAEEVSSGKKIPLDEDSEDESSEPEIAGTKTYDFNCELGNKVTIYRNDGDDKYIAIRWDKRVRRLTRVKTTTGANRFENHLAGLVWIGIPAKSMLLDSKKGQQLANECKLIEPAVAADAAPAKS